jgi:hypothetical protein
MAHRLARRILATANRTNKQQKAFFFFYFHPFIHAKRITNEAKRTSRSGPLRARSIQMKKLPENAHYFWQNNLFSVQNHPNHHGR